MVCRYFGCSSKVLRHWGISSIGRASALQAEGQEFDSPMLHILKSGFLFGGPDIFYFCACSQVGVKGHFRFSCVAVGRTPVYVFPECRNKNTTFKANT